MLILFTGLINPAVDPIFGTGGTEAAPNMLATLIASLWSAALVLGSLAVIIFIASGAFAWITSNGDKAKVEAARDRIVAAIIGLAILFSMFALVSFIFPRIGLDILNIEIQDNLNGGGNQIPSEVTPTNTDETLNPDL